MGFLYPTIRIGAIWLTAVAVLTAGLPYGRCRCPNGNIKLFCLGLTSQSCCCGGDCCSGAAAPSAPKACCCQGRHETDRHAQVGSQGCQKTLMPAVLVPGVPPQSAAQDVSVAGPFLPLVSAFPLSATDAAHALPSWQCHQLPPPTDLVITHLHLVI